jgi:hypothetical protein
MKRGTIVDYKKREQWDAGRVPHPDDNDQLFAYALGAGLTHFRLCLLLFGGGKVEPIWSQAYSPANTAPILERIIATCAPKSVEPKGTSGAHCGQCWPRIHCPHWAKRAESEPDPTDGEALLLAAKSREETAKKYRALASDLAPFRVGSQEYRRVMMPGKMTVDTAALEQAGLYERFARPGQPFATYRLCKPRED